MHGRMARYTYTGDALELARKAEDGMLPIFQAQPGFKSYSLVESDGEILSFSAWDSAAAAARPGVLSCYNGGVHFLAPVGTSLMSLPVRTLPVVQNWDCHVCGSWST